jgi:histidinol-phosphate phosphatase family protein
MPSLDKRGAVFLDRDGTIIVEKNYLSAPDQVMLLDGVVDGLARLGQQGLPLIIVSNQSGIGRGYFTMQDLAAVNARIDELLKAEGVTISGWYICPHAPEMACKCRKPLPGLIDAACSDHDLDPELSFVIGDKRTDLDLAAAVGAHGILVTTGYGIHEVDYAQTIGAPVYSSILEASGMILTEQALRGT